MKSYESLLENAVQFIWKYGRTQETINQLEKTLPAAWSANIIADALDMTI